jgi:hypothetical protein
LVVFALIFLPMSIWFAYSNWHKYWLRSAVLFAVSGAFLWLAFSRSERSWISAIDDLGGPNPD